MAKAGNNPLEEVPKIRRRYSDADAAFVGATDEAIKARFGRD